MRTTALVVAATTAFAASVGAIDPKRVYSSKISVQTPEDMIGEIDHRSALFGSLPAGQSFERNLYYTGRSLCDGQTPGTPDEIKAKGYFLLVDRGGCSFVEKVRNAQRDNATAVLIADDTCLCAFEEYCSGDSDQPCESSEPTMDDDGSGEDITIPSMLLFKPDGDALKSVLVDGQDMTLELSWPIPEAQDGVTEYTLWMTPDDLLSHQFLMSFYDAAAALGSQAVFKPRMFIKDGAKHDCRFTDGQKDPCPGSCTHNGRYCEHKSYYDFETYANKGTKMLLESQRRACIWNVYGESDGIGREWWAYLKAWILKCGSSRFSTSCAESLFIDAGIDGKSIDECTTAAGSFENNTPNLFFDIYLEEQEAYDVTFAPTMFVNGAVVRGSLTFGSTLSAICSSYNESEIPPTCQVWTECESSCPSGSTCVLRGGRCAEYQVPQYESTKDSWDDDLLNPDGGFWEITSAPTAAEPTKAPMQPPTPKPTQQKVESPPPTKAKATPSPVAAPKTKEPVEEVKEVSDTPVGGDSPQVVETIQIYEGGRGEGGSDGTFWVGIVAGASAAILLSTIIFALLSRNKEPAAMMRPLVSSHQSFSESHYDDDEDYEEVIVRRPRRWPTERVRRFAHRFQRKPRRTIHRSRQDKAHTHRSIGRMYEEYGDDDDDSEASQVEDHYVDEEVVRIPSPSNVAHHKRSAHMSEESDAAGGRRDRQSRNNHPRRAIDPDSDDEHFPTRDFQ